MANPGPDGTGREGALREVEAWLADRGLPQLIDGYRPVRSVVTRSAPIALVLLAGAVYGATVRDWTWWGVAGACLTAPIAVALVYLAINFGAAPLTRWAAIHLARELTSVLSLGARALPLLLVFGVVLVVNTEVWQMSASLGTTSLAAVVALFVLVGGALLTVRIPREIQGLETWDGPDDLARRLAGTPAERLGFTGPGAPDCPAPPPLRHRQWANLGLVLLFAQGLQVLIVAVTVGAFFAGFGMLAITPATAELWTGAGLDRWASLDIGERDLVLSGELVKVAVFLGGLAGLSFAISAVTDETYRREFFDDVLADLRRVLAVRAAYLAALARPDGRDLTGT